MGFVVSDDLDELEKADDEYCKRLQEEINKPPQQRRARGRKPTSGLASDAAVAASLGEKHVPPKLASAKKHHAQALRKKNKDVRNAQVTADLKVLEARKQLFKDQNSTIKAQEEIYEGESGDEEVEGLESTQPLTSDSSTQARKGGNEKLWETMDKCPCLVCMALKKFSK